MTPPTNAELMVAAGLQRMIPTTSALAMRNVEYRRVIRLDEDGVLGLLQVTRENNGAAVWLARYNRTSQQWADPQLVTFELQAEDALETAVGMWIESQSVEPKRDANGQTTEGRKALVNRKRRNAAAERE